MVEYGSGGGLMFTRLNGVDIFYKVPGHGRPMLTIHGGPGISDHREAEAAFRPLEDHFSLVYYDQRGSGQSSEADPRTYTHRQFAQDAEALRKHLGHEKVILLGGSYGGFIAMEYALLYPEAVSHLILRGTASHKGFIESAINNALAANITGLNRQSLEKMFNGNLESEEELLRLFTCVYPLYFKRAVPKAAGIKLRDRSIHINTHNAIFSEIFPAYDINSRLPEMKVPTLVLCGDGDWVTPPAYSEEIARLIPEARLDIFENCGHAVHADYPDKFIHEILSFVG